MAATRSVRSLIKSTAFLLGGAAALALCAAACSGSSSKGGTGGSAGTATAGNTSGASGDAGANGGAANGGSSGSTGNSGSAGSSGAGGGPTPGMGAGGNPIDGEIGARCATNADCREELVCAPSTQDLGGSLGGVPEGFCTLQCDPVQQNADCAALSTVATCLTFNNGTPDDSADDRSFCMERCLLGTAPAIENKCHQRPELACWPLDINFGFCAPSCANDADCGDRFCDLATGTCLAQAPAGDPIGATCTLEDDQCAGFCLQFTDDTNGSSCSGTCTFGTRGCGDDPDSMDPANFVCMPDINSFGQGDLGVCVQACDCNIECGNPGNVCLPMPDPVFVEFYGRAGYCAPPFPSATGADAGAGAGAVDAGADAGTVDDPLATGIVSCP